MVDNIQVDVKIRKATAQDIPSLVQFLQPFVDDGHLLPRTFSEMEELLDGFFIAEVGDKLVGCAALEIYNRKLAEIRSLAVSPDARGMGVGKKLVQACVDMAKEHHIFEIMAISAEERFFASCGFDYTLPKLRKAYFLQTRDEL